MSVKYDCCRQLFWLCVCIGVGLTAELAGATNQTWSILSPDGRLKCTITRGEGGVPKWAFSYRDRSLIEPSWTGFETAQGGKVPNQQWKHGSVKLKNVQGEWSPIWGKRAVVQEVYRELTIPFLAPSSVLQQGEVPGEMNLVVRVYNDGMAFRYEFPQMKTQDKRPFVRDLTEFCFAGNYSAWFYNGEHHNIGPERIESIQGERWPVMTIDAGKQCFMAIHEADLRTGEPLKLNFTKGNRVMKVSSRPGKPGVETPFAWRVIFCGDTPGTAVDSHLLELLNPQPPKGMDFSWVKPGVCVWDWRINGAEVNGFRYGMDYPSWVRMIDFAAQHGIKHLVLDANWYGPEFDDDSNPLEGGKANDVRKIIHYGKGKGVGVWLYLNDVGGRRYPISQTLEQYASWGASGVKYGFMTGTPEEKNERTRMITEICAKNHLLVDFHDGPVHPYGQMRTWPNAVTREFCHAQLDAHRVFQPKTFVTSVFVNMVAGPLDMNNGMFDLRPGKTTRVDENQPVPSTLASEAARTLITFSGATILPDIPEFYCRYPELLQFIEAQQMPWKNSKTLAGEIGKFIVMARESANGCVLIGAVTNEEARTVVVDLSFLPDGTYQASIVQDGADAHYLKKRESIRTERRSVTPRDSIELKLAPGGGACVLMRLQKKS